MCLLTICINVYCLKKRQFTSFILFKIGLSFLLSSYDTLYSLDPRPLSDIRLANIFSHAVDCPSTFLIMSFDMKNFFDESKIMSFDMFLKFGLQNAIKSLHLISLNTNTGITVVP